MNCVLLGASVGCKNMHGTSNIKVPLNMFEVGYRLEWKSSECTVLNAYSKCRAMEVTCVTRSILSMPLSHFQHRGAPFLSRFTWNSCSSSTFFNRISWNSTNNTTFKN